MTEYNTSRLGIDVALEIPMIKLVFAKRLLGLMFILPLTLSSPSWAALTCENIFTYHFSFNNPPKGVFHKMKSVEEFDRLKPQIKLLAAELLKANRDFPQSDLIYFTEKMAEVFAWIDQKKDFEVSLIDLLPRTNYALVEIKLGDQIVKIRTNGEHAFLSSTLLYRHKDNINNYKAVGLIDGKIQSFTQTDLILSTLPETVVLSRNMEEAERQLWLDNKEFTSRAFGNKVHFGPNHFLFKATEPYRVTLQKKDLIAFHRLGLLELNVYDPVNRYEDRMQLTKLGLEFEYVFVGQKAVELLRPRIKDQLRQQVLKYD